MYSVILIVWLMSGETKIVPINTVTFDSKPACLAAAPYLARLKQRDLPPMQKGKARCIEASDPA